MQLRHIEVNRCGALTNLQIADLRPGLNVVLGPNGSGKTSLLRFVRELLSDAARRPHSPHAMPVAAGAIDLQSRQSSLRLLRIDRPGHPDTVATVATAVSEIDRPRTLDGTDDVEATALVRFVESSAVHQCPALANLAETLTRQLGEQELGADWSRLQSLTVLRATERHAAAPLIDVVRRLAQASNPNDRDLNAIDSNWQLVIDAVAQQREQLRLEWESRVRIQTRQQRDWETQLRWLRERAGRQLQEIEQLDADWQAAMSDLSAVRSTQTALAGSDNHHSTVRPDRRDHDTEHSLTLLAQILEDLSRDRLHTILQFAHASSVADERLAAELLRIDACEQEIVARMQHLRRRRAANDAAEESTCPMCGARRTERPASSGTEPVDPAAVQRCAELRQQLAAARSAHAATGRRMARIETRRRRAANDASADRMRFDLSTLDAQIEELQHRRSADLAAWAIAIRRDVGRKHDILRSAGRNLARLTAGHYTSLRWSPEDQTLLAAGPSGESTPADALSRGTSEQIAMSLRLALLGALTKLGQDGPVLWDEPLADSDEQRLAAAAALLAEHGRSGTQLLLFTCREHVAQAMQGAGANVLRLGRPQSALPEPAVPTLSVAAIEDEPEPVAIEASPPEAVSMRVLPGGALWLQFDDPVDQIPSISQQMARRLRALGVADIRDLLEFDPGANAISLTDVQIPPAHVHIWQAEARLLTEVPELTGRDAQLLVSCGIMSRQQLAAANVDEMTKRIDRLRGGDTLRWRMGPSTAPHRETIERWVEAAGGLPPVDPVTSAAIDADRSATRRRRRRRATLRREHRSGAAAAPSLPAIASRFRLQPDSPIVDAPSIGQKTARRLQRIGILTVRDLLACDPTQTAARLRHRRINTETVQAWQQQSGLMCSVPDLRCADAMVLVACGIAGPLDLRRISASTLHAMLAPFIAGGAGQRLLRGATPPTFADISRWIDTVEESRVRRAA